MTRVSFIGRVSKTIQTSRYILKNPKELNHFRIPLLIAKENRMNHLERQLDSTIVNNTNNYRKIMHTYFEPYD